MGDLLGSDRAEVLILCGQGFELLLGFDNFPLQGIIFVLTQRAVFQLFLCLLLCLFQGVQTILGSGYRFLQSLLLLGEELSIGRVQLQQFVQVFQL